MSARGLEAMTDQELAAERDRQYPRGATVSIDDNVCECETWTVGERRCSCGNRRMYLDHFVDSSGNPVFYPAAD